MLLQLGLCYLILTSIGAGSTKKLKPLPKDVLANLEQAQRNDEEAFNFQEIDDMLEELLGGNSDILILPGKDFEQKIPNSGYREAEYGEDITNFQQLDHFVMFNTFLLDTVVFCKERSMSLARLDIVYHRWAKITDFPGVLDLPTRLQEHGLVVNGGRIQHLCPNLLGRFAQQYPHIIRILR